MDADNKRVIGYRSMAVTAADPCSNRSIRAIDSYCIKFLVPAERSTDNVLWKLRKRDFRWCKVL